MQLRGQELFSHHQDRVQQLLDQIASRQKIVDDQPQEETPFASLMTEGIGRVNAHQLDSQDLVEQLLSGGDVNQAEVFTSVQKADMSFRLLVQIRNKLMQAYEELNSIRV
ncbi:flagellar hook-basal body protein FliE [Pirellula sp. SH-Sr6A]|uniref:flagellar hook-basal body complex protein FliE n=1 Tax=Pirellula sp. SH-Sr6A TaxID=1632865 RepID=UPI00078E8F39|nr:flagellar hook-basal body complex protein FliE [Pirellula sp. SH-Sr6A]AMV33793.1 flagellar hook-basal body protein FliE [Pirellula sp. SH-Sr6A]